MLSACAGGSPAGRAGAVHLVLLGTGDANLYAQLLPRFEAAHPGIRVQLTMASSGPAGTVTTSLVGGSGPDVFWVQHPSSYLERPLLLPLDALVRGSGYDLTAFSPPVLASGRAAGGLRLLPRSASPGAYAVRADFFSAAGLQVPSGPYTAAELAGLWQRLTGQGRTGGDLVWSSTSSFYLTGWGANLVDPADTARSGLAAPAAITCGQWMWDRFWQDRSAAGLQGQASGASLLRGTLAMKVITASALPVTAGAYRGLSWRLSPFPVWPAAPATFADVDYFGISATTAHPSEAWLLLAYITSAAWETAEATTSLVCPARTALWPAYLTALRQAVPPLKSQPLEIFSTALEQGQALPPARFRYQAAAQAVLQPLWTEIFGPARSLAVATGFTQGAAAVATAEAQAGAAWSAQPRAPAQ